MASPLPRYAMIQFAHALIAAERRLLEGIGLPTANDLAGDWARYFDADSLSPLMCSGHFTDSGTTEYAFFVLSESELRYKVVVLTENEQGEPVVEELESGEGRPANLFLGAVLLARSL